MNPDEIMMSTLLLIFILVPLLTGIKRVISIAKDKKYFHKLCHTSNRY